MTQLGKKFGGLGDLEWMLDVVGHSWELKVRLK